MSRVDAEVLAIEGDYAFVNERLAKSEDELAKLRARKSVRLALRFSRAARPLFTWWRKRTGNPNPRNMHDA